MFHGHKLWLSSFDISVVMIAAASVSCMAFYTEIVAAKSRLVCRATFGLWSYNWGWMICLFVDCAASSIFRRYLIFKRMRKENYLTRALYT